MWYGHIPSVKHLRVFGSTYYALIPKVHRNKLGARSHKCIFLGYSNTSKTYHLYDEENQKFVVSRDVIFLESSKTDNVVEQLLDRLDRFANAKSYQEFDNQIPHLEGRIPILDQPVESSSEALSPPHETPTTDDTFSDVIDKIGRLNLDLVPTQSTEQPGPLEKGPPKWMTKTLESVHPDEILNQLPSKKLFLMMNGKKRCKRSMIIKNDTWKLVDPPFGTKPIGCKWVYKNKYKADVSLDKHKARLVAKGFAQKEGVDYEETFTPTAKWATIRTLFALAAQNGWEFHQMDVKTAFLNGDIKENVFMSQPE
eukprot:PITA_25980